MEAYPRGTLLSGIVGAWELSAGRRQVVGTAAARHAARSGWGMGRRRARQPGAGTLTAAAPGPPAPQSALLAGTGAGCALSHGGGAWASARAPLGDQACSPPSDIVQPFRSLLQCPACACAVPGVAGGTRHHLTYVLLRPL